MLLPVPAVFALKRSLYNKRVRPTKNEPQQGISYLDRARGGGAGGGG
jgi:hypothetical protein